MDNIFLLQITLTDANQEDKGNKETCNVHRKHKKDKNQDREMCRASERKLNKVQKETNSETIGVNEIVRAE